MQRQLMDCVENAAFPGQGTDEIDRLLHMVVAGGGPTGIELSGDRHDFLEDRLKSWYPEVAGKIRITLGEALPSVLPMFSKQLIHYTESTFKESKIELTKTMVKEVKEKSVVLQLPVQSIVEVPCGGMVVLTGDYLRQRSPPNAGADESIFAIGDCTSSTYAPTAQVASQQGAYLARQFQQLAQKDILTA
ncbi:hypothetical protein FIBSPDRAFT_1046183 [Athelia psychrophila]|uniref:NADH:ubiquinone reductase (non-electrogenic) n=1 Tax=Athelia psychrophila TaxID=1759441 RepID=A0A166H5D0_9AGAM|nr:hypothetical protein FIBSPDRAFT_1046183 [Fibularhizoctonia sp. CBS 109695]